jgi:hypothetical protein
LKIPSQTMAGTVVYVGHPSYTGKHKWENHGLGQFRPKTRSYLKNNQSKKGWGYGSCVKHLPSKHEALSLSKNSIL